ncbi:MAG: SDR family oxidoreductase [Oligoflexia bacterium]|nr:SDR family oxidoreductase [Oligoflexia bacterium]
MKKQAVLITGAGSGIGEATAKLFSQNGHDVILVGRRLEKLNKVAKSLKTKAYVFKCDISNVSQVRKLSSEIKKKCPHLGILVNNAACFEQISFQKTSQKLWSQMLNTNLMGPVNLIYELIDLLIKNKNSSVVNVASTAGLRPLSGMIAYSTTKAALIHLTQSLALEYANVNVKFHAVCPGVVDTPIHKGNRKEDLKEMGKWHPLGRVGTSEEVANAIYYLACQASWMTGVVLPVDGGISLT